MTHSYILKTTTRAISLTLGLAVASGAFAAGGGQTPLGDCYNRVITICNEGSHPGPCIDNALDACDEEYGDAAAAKRPDDLKVRDVSPIGLGLTIVF